MKLTCLLYSTYFCLASLHKFQFGWNNHQLSTENNLSPLQLYYTAYAQGSHLFEDEIHQEMYGRDLTLEEDDDDDEVDKGQIIVPQTCSLGSIEQVYFLSFEERIGLKMRCRRPQNKGRLRK